MHAVDFVHWAPLAPIGPHWPPFAIPKGVKSIIKQVVSVMLKQNVSFTWDFGSEK